MKNKIIKISMIALFFTFMGIIRVDAASANITASKTTCNTGEAVTISVSVVAGAWDLTVSGPGISDHLVDAPTSADTNSNIIRSYSFGASGAGTYTITLTGNIVDYNTEVESDINKSVTITVNAPAQQQTEPSQQPSNPSTPSQPSQQQQQQTTQQQTTQQHTQQQTEQQQQTGPKEVKKEESIPEPPISVKNIEVSGYNIDFKENVYEYTIEIDKGATSLYIESTSNANPSVKGKIDIKDKSEVVITFKKGTETKTYTIKLKEKKVNAQLLSVPTEEQTTKKSNNFLLIAAIVFAITSSLFLIFTVVSLILQSKK